MHIVGRYGALHHTVKRPRLYSAIRKSITPTAVLRHAHQLIPPIELNANPNPKAKDIAVIGGGITGLTTAYHLQRTIPYANITIYDQQERLGGWLASEVIEVDGGEVLFEWGARSLRPDMNGAGLATVMLLTQLNVAHEALCIPTTSPAALNRYVYYPDHLVKMPGPSPSGGPLMAMVRGLYTMLTEPLFKGIFSAILSEPAVAPRAPSVADESVGSFIKRRFGSGMADNLVSAVLHGIYAGDLYKLSARTLLPSLWYAETRDKNGNGVIAEYTDLFFKGQGLRAYKDVQFRNLAVAAKDFPPPGSDPVVEAFLNSIARAVSVYTFPQGTAFLGSKLKLALDESKRVTYRTGEPIGEINYKPETNQVAIKTSDERTFDYVVSTLSPSNLKDCLGSTNSSSTANSIAANSTDAMDQVSDAASVMVVNLYYSDPNLIPLSHAGFGYLIPRSIPVEQNPERALGVIFGSESSGVRGSSALMKMPRPTKEDLDQKRKEIDECKAYQVDENMDPKTREKWQADLELLEKTHEKLVAELDLPDMETRWGQDTAPGTKLTVMMGGHWWTGWSQADMPSETEAVDMAKALLARHLNIQQDPAIAKARLNINCIPQYPVGYRQRMATIHEGLMNKFEGRMKVAGPWWQGGVGVNDCTRKARLAALSIREQWDDKTGLEEYTEDEKWVLMDRRTNRAIMDPMQG